MIQLSAQSFAPKNTEVIILKLLFELPVTQNDLDENIFWVILNSAKFKYVSSRSILSYKVKTL
jgi:hypothetical protein